MKVVDLNTLNTFNDLSMQRNLVHDSAYFRVINFNIGAGKTFPVHSHDQDGQLTIQVLEGSGEFLGADDAAIPAKAGDIREPHGVHAHDNMRILVTIAPPL